MKKKLLAGAVILLIAITAISLTACDDSGNNGNTNTPTTFTVTYNGNANTGGTVPTDSNSPYQNGTKVTVLGNTGNLVKTNNTFTGWNTKGDGTGTTYTQGSEFNISANTILYAEWLPDDTPLYKITLDPSEEITFTDATVGYSEQTPHIVTINNTGNRATGELTIALTGTNSESFTLSKNTSTIAVGGNDSFTVVPKTGLSENTYIAVVTVTGGNNISESFNISFTVNVAVPMFWYGNYIPDTELNIGTVSASAVFNLDELIANRDNARIRRSLPAGQPTNENNIILNQDGTIYGVYNSSGALQGTTTGKNTSTGTLRWEEKKSFETAVKANKSIDFQNSNGFMYFISPANFGNISIVDGVNIPATGQFTKHEVKIDNLDYFIYRMTNTVSSNNIINFKFNFN